MTIPQAVAILTAAYSAEIKFRQGVPQSDADTRENILALATFLTNPNHKFGVLLNGNVGNGKTTLMRAFQQATGYLVQRGYFDDLQPDNGFVGLVIKNARQIAQEAKDVKIDQRNRAAFMFGIDDLGTEPTEVVDYGNVLNPVIDLLEYRYTMQLFTFVTTNLTRDEIYEKYGDRIGDRFREMFSVITFSHDSYR